MLGYRMIVEVPGHRADVEKIVMSQLSSWLRARRRLDPDLLVSGREVALGATGRGFLQELVGQDGSRSVRARVTEDTDSGRWVTSLTLHIPGDKRTHPWVWLDVDGPEGRKAGLPRLARDLLNVLGDARTRTALSAKPEIVGMHDIDTVYDHLVDSSRRRLVFVAGSDAQMPLPRWQDLLATLLHDTVGLAAAFVLDAEATVALAEKLGPAHAVTPGTLRTFVDRVVPDDSADALRHRILTTQRILQGDTKAVASILGSRARTSALAIPLPRAAVRIDRLLERQIDTLVVAQATGIATSVPEQVARAPEAASARTHEEVSDRDAAVSADVPTRSASRNSPLAPPSPELNRILSAVLGATEAAEGDIDRVIELARAGAAAQQRQEMLAMRLAHLQEQLEAAQDEVTGLQLRLEDEQLETAQLFGERQELDALIRHLRALLAATDAASRAWEEPEPAAAAPGSFHELLSRFDELDGVSLTMPKQDAALELDQNDPLGTWAAKTWQALLALRDYVACKRDGSWGGGVHGYLQATPAGRCGWSDRRHGQDESEAVKRNPAHRRERVLPVPTSVAAGGEVFMGAHFKIAQSGLISPRMHYFDAVGVDGSVYVGYIGPHLPTKRTN